MKRSFAGSLTALGVILGGISGAAAASLQDELGSLIDSHPQIQASQSLALGSQEGVREAFAGYLPRVTLSGDSGYSHINSPARRSASLDPFSRTRHTVSVVASQTLYDGGLTTSNHRAARLRQTVAETEVSNTQQMVMLEGINAYLDVLRQQSLLDLALQNEGTIKRQLDLEDERVRGGSGISVDVLQAKSRLQLALERRVSIEGAFRQAVSRYEQVFGRVPEVGSMAPPALPLAHLPASSDDAVVMALNNNPAIFSTDTQSAIAQENRDAARAGYMPRVSLDATAALERHKDGTMGDRREYSVLLRANWAVFDGFATQAAVARASYEHAATRDNALHTRRKVEEQTEISWEALQTARRRVELLENAVVIAQEVFVARQRLREAGQETVISVLDAENEVYNARINLTSAEFDARAAAFQLLTAMGSLDLSAVSSQ